MAMYISSCEHIYLRTYIFSHNKYMQPYVHNYTEFRVHMCVIAEPGAYIYLSINWSSVPGSGCKTNCMETILIF